MSRQRIVDRGPSCQPVPHADHRLDDRRLAELAAQRHDRDADGVGERVGVLVPHPLEQLLGADDATVGGHQHLEHAELLAGEVQVAPGADGHPAPGVERDVGPLEHRRDGRGELRRPRARMRATSSFMANGFGR